MNKETIESKLKEDKLVISSQMKVDQIKILDLYKQVSSDDTTILPFLVNFNRKLTSLIEELSCDSK